MDGLFMNRTSISHDKNKNMSKKQQEEGYRSNDNEEKSNKRKKLLEEVEKGRERPVLKKSSSAQNLLLEDRTEKEQINKYMNSQPQYNNNFTVLINLFLVKSHSNKFWNMLQRIRCQ